MVRWRDGEVEEEDFGHVIISFRTCMCVMCKYSVIVYVCYCVCVIQLCMCVIVYVCYCVCVSIVYVCYCVCVSIVYVCYCLCVSIVYVCYCVCVLLCMCVYCVCATLTSNCAMIFFSVFVGRIVQCHSNQWLPYGLPFCQSHWAGQCGCG